MATNYEDFDLPEGWSCRVELKQELEGTFGGRAELWWGHTQRCVFVLAEQPSREIALVRMKARIDQFIQEWNTRP